MNPDQIKLKRILSNSFEGIIWKIELNEQNGLIAVESRISETKKTAFSVINYFTGEFYLKEKIFEDSWNLSLAYVTESSLILTTYSQAEIPEFKGIISFNIQRGELNWQYYNLSLNRATNDGLQVFDPRINPRRYYWISDITGETIPESNLLNLNLSSLLLPELKDTFDFPNYIMTNEIVGQLSILVIRDMEILSFHEKILDHLHQRLLVCKNNHILIDEILIKDIQKLQPESFFIQKNYLFYIRNKNEIVSYLV